MRLPTTAEVRNTALSTILSLAACGGDGREQTEFEKFQMDAYQENGYFMSMDLGPQPLNEEGLHCRPSLETLATDLVVVVHLIDPGSRVNMPERIEITEAKVYRDGEGQIEAFCGANVTSEDVLNSDTLRQGIEFVLPNISWCAEGVDEFRAKTGFDPERDDPFGTFPCYGYPLVYDLDNPVTAGPIQLPVPNVYWSSES